MDLQAFTQLIKNQEQLLNLISMIHNKESDRVICGRIESLQIDFQDQLQKALIHGN